MNAKPFQKLSDADIAALSVAQLQSFGYHAKYLSRLNKIDVSWNEWDSERNLKVSNNKRLDNTAVEVLDFLYGENRK